MIVSLQIDGEGIYKAVGPIYPYCGPSPLGYMLDPAAESKAGSDEAIRLFPTRLAYISHSIT